MITYTHIFSNNTKEAVPMSEAVEAIKSAEFIALGFSLLDMSKVKFDKHGMPSRTHGGWSYGHVRHGWICAGAGGLNSMRVMEIKQQED